MLFFEATIKRAPVGSVCIFGAQYIIGRDLCFPSGSKLNLLGKEMFS